MRKTISVNDPLRFGGITIYQTDWSFSALQILKDGEGPFNLAMAPLKLNGDKKLFGTFLPVGDAESPSVKGMYVFICLCVCVDIPTGYADSPKVKGIHMCYGQNHVFCLLNFFPSF